MRAPGYQIHKQQLFHWIGRNLDKDNKGRKVLSDDLVTKCLDYVHQSIESGLWVKCPSVPEEFALDEDKLLLKRPITCFTEWSLGDSLPHTERYGRIGFGFPKRWVIERGGQSVTYFRHAEKSSFLKGIFRLLKAHGVSDGNGDWNPKDPANELDEVMYFLHFAKMIRERREKGVAKPKPTPVKRVKPPIGAKPAVPTFRRRFGSELPFVEEREWRIVHHPEVKHFTKGPGTPEYYLKYIPGDELFTLVLPDNKTVSKLLQTTWFTKRLFTPHLVYRDELKGRAVPPVMVLAHSDLRTF
jgi:hypothetical protein